MKEGPPIAVLKTDGINCDGETMAAFRLAGAQPELVHLNQLRTGERKLADYRAMVIPGGFADGDAVASGKILAIQLNTYLGDQIHDFVHGKGGLVLGVCNGFQALVRTGLLPFGTIGEMQATLRPNASGHFECRWVKLLVEKNTACVFLPDMKGVVSYQVAHGEGQFTAPPQTLARIETEKLVVFRYCNEVGDSTQEYPANPNGAVNAIAGICDPSGRILGLMPHPERYTLPTHHPNWRRPEMQDIEPQGLQVFQQMVAYAAQM